MESSMSLTLSGCLQRQQRLRERMALLEVEAAFITDARDIYYFTGALLPLWPACLAMTTAGGAWLAAHTREGVDAGVVNDCITYDAQTFYTNNPDPMRLLNGVVARYLDGAPPLRRAAMQTESMSRLLAGTIERTLHLQEWGILDDELADLQARKDADEIALIRRSIRANQAAYTAVQAIIAPGINELDVLAAGQHAAMLDAGEIVIHNGDYRSGALGGAARNRPIEVGELYTVDAQTVYRGYWCDMSRTYSVGRAPSELQQSIYEHIAAIQSDVVHLLKPGLRGTQLWAILDARIREHPALATSGLMHHAGHGVGLRAHEAPDLNRDREGVLEAGHVVAVEPGGYVDEARYGVRLENMYLITESGAELLSDDPLSLMPQQ
jgi:Xaa-Pro aminopeptidase/Xaa-Pro dipeptidase